MLAPASEMPTIFSEFFRLGTKIPHPVAQKLPRVRRCAVDRLALAYPFGLVSGRRDRSSSGWVTSYEHPVRTIHAPAWTCLARARDAHSNASDSCPIAPTSLCREPSLRRALHIPPSATATPRCGNAAARFMATRLMARLVDHTPLCSAHTAIARDRTQLPSGTTAHALCRTLLQRMITPRAGLPTAMPAAGTPGVHLRTAARAELTPQQEPRTRRRPRPTVRRAMTTGAAQCPTSSAR
jgi:hypothetical protein